MAAEINWQSFLDNHPIFSRPENSEIQDLPEVSLSSLKELEKIESDDAVAASRRRQLMCMKDSDLIVACGSEIRMASLGDAKLSGGSKKLYKVLHTPSINFEIHQICLNPNRKLLAVSGASQVAVVVLPRIGFSKLGTSRIDCKSLQIGTSHHSNPSSPIVKVDWHPWGEAGSTLLVMTADGKLREYDVSLDPDEPRNTLDFVAEKKKGSYAAVDDSEREVASFTFGKGRADWGPLTLYAVMRSGDIYAICPYLPEKASVPSSYLRALECFVLAKEEFAAGNNGEIDESFSTLYDYQRKYVNSLIRQLPADRSASSATRLVPIISPKSFPGYPSRQGPYFLQPSPPDLKDSPGADATDIAYVTLGSAFTSSEDQEDAEVSSLASERLGAILVAFQDGKVDVFLDLEKVEGMWDTTESSLYSRPALSTYETIDLGIVATLESSAPAGSSNASALNLIEQNNITFYLDPIHDDTLYTYHAFGVHVLNLNAIFQSLAAAIKEGDEKAFQNTVQESAHTCVRAILSTYSVERRSARPVNAVAVSNDVYLTYSIFVLTSTMRAVAFPLNLRSDSTDGLESSWKQQEYLELPTLPQSSGPPAYVSLLATEPFVLPPVLTRPIGSTTIAKLPLPPSCSAKTEIRLTPPTLRYLTNVQERISGEIHEALIACHALKSRGDLQKQEYERLQRKSAEILDRTQALLGTRRAAFQERLKVVKAEQTKLLSRMDRLLHALIRQASPELNENETRWFAELQRMKAQVLGVGRYDPDCLRIRIKQLEVEFERLMPALKKLASEETERKARLEEESTGAGYSYVKPYEKMSKFESKKLDDAKTQIAKLARKLEIISLSPPPLQ